MQGQSLIGPTLDLSGEDAIKYVDALRGAIRAARLSKQFTDARAMSSHIEAMGLAIQHGIYDSLQIGLHAGLPTYRDWTRIQSDVAVAADALAKLPSELELGKRAATSPIHAKQLAKRKYYAALVGRRIAPLAEMDVKLRRVEPEINTAFFHVVFDKFDASGLFVRYTIDMAQRSSAYVRKLVQLDDEVANHTEEFRALIYRSASLDAEFTLAQLAATVGMSVERVAKCSVGPFYGRPFDAPEGLRGAMEAAPGLVATFGSDTAARDVTVDRNNDPLDAVLLDKLSAQARAGYAVARDNFQYRVFKDRKFVVPRSSVDALRGWLETTGTKNIVYTTR